MHMPTRKPTVIAPLDEELSSSEVTTGARKETGKGVVYDTDGRPHYIATYVDAEELLRDNALLHRSAERQRSSRFTSIRMVGVAFMALSVTIVMFSLVYRSFPLFFYSLYLLILGLGLLGRRLWTITLLKFTIILMVFAALISIMISNWTGVGPSVATLAWIAIPFIVIVSVFAFLIEPRVKDLLD
jgi:ABC-type multidrug transport system permease subunit